MRNRLRLPTVVASLVVLLLAVPTARAQPLPTADELLSRMRARLADAATCRIEAAVERCWFQAGDVRRRQRKSYAIDFERSGPRLRLIATAFDGRREGEGAVVLLDGGTAQRWDAHADMPGAAERAADGLSVWELDLEQSVETLLELLDPRLIARELRPPSAHGASVPAREVVDGVECFRIDVEASAVGAAAGGASGSGGDLEQWWLAVDDARPVRWRERWRSSGGEVNETTTTLAMRFDPPLPADAFAMVRPPPGRFAGVGGATELVAFALLAGAPLLAMLLLHLRLRRHRVVAMRDSSFVLLGQYSLMGALFLPQPVGAVALALTGWEAMRWGIWVAPGLLFLVPLGFYLSRFTRYDYRFQQRRMVWGVAPKVAAPWFEAAAAAAGIDLECKGARYEDRRTGEEWRLEGGPWLSTVLGPRGAPERFERVVASFVEQVRAQPRFTPSNVFAIWLAIEVVLVGALAWWKLQLDF